MSLDHAVADGLRERLADLEARLARTEDRAHSLANRCQRAEMIVEALVAWADPLVDDDVIGQVDGAAADALAELVDEARAVLEARRE